MDTALVEAFNSRFRQECLNAHWFMTLDDAQTKIDRWRQEYNEDRPHSALGYRTPAQCIQDNIEATTSAA